MSDKSEQSNEQSDSKAADGLKSIDELRSMSFADIGKELSSKDYSKVEEADQADENSETSDESSTDDQNQETVDQSSTEDQTDEQDSNEEETNSSETDDATSDNQKDSNSKSKKKFDVEKAYKELQGEFTRRNQEMATLKAKLAEIESNSTKSPSKDEASKVDNSKLAQLRKKDPEAAAALEALIQEQVDKQVKEKVKPVEEQVTLRRRQENADRFSKSLGEFQKSELGSMEPQLLDIYNENPAYWQQLVLDGENAFDSLKKELLFRHFDKAAELKAKKSKEAKSSSEKQDRLKGSQVGTKTKVTTPTRDVMSDDEFKNLPLAEMEKRLKKVRN